MKPIALTPNKVSRRIKISLVWILLTISTPFIMISAIGTLRGPSGAEYDICGFKNKLLSYW